MKAKPASFRVTLFALATLVAATTAPATAHAGSSNGPGWSLAGVWGGVDYSMPWNSAVSSTPQVSLPSAGVVFDVDLGFPWLSLTVDALYVQRAWTDSGILNLSEGVLQDNVIVRFWPAQHWFAIGVGAYSAYGLSFSAAGTPASMATYGINPWDFGLTANLVLNFRITDSWSIVWDNRYDFGILSVAATPPANFTHHDFLTMLGVRFAMSDDSF